MKKNYIGGQWLGGDNAIDNINPSDTRDVIDSYALAGQAQVAAAVEAAADAFAHGGGRSREGWRDSTPQQRADVLDRIGDEILARRQELGDLLAREEGKTLAEAVGEAGRAGQIFKFFAGEALRMGGECLPSIRPGVEVEIYREPLGIVGIITPWNFPIAIPAWKIAPALAYGNCVLFKPAGLVPGCAWALADIISRAGLPDGVFNLVMGSGAVAGQRIIEDPAVAAISFTGSTPVGRRIATACASRGAKVQLEMGGKNPLVVLDDADLDTAVDTAINGAYFSTGQRCTASSRLIVQRGIHDAFVEALSAKIRMLAVGDARADGTEIGPVVDQSQLNQDIEYLDIGRNEGAELLVGGECLECATPGYYLSPALFVETDNTMRINRDEIFGPVASVIRVDDFEQAMAVANDTEFGLSSGIITTSLRSANEFRRRSEAGMVMVNLPTAGVDYHVPFGGRKGSSYGAREQGTYAREFYTGVKTAYLAY